MPIEIGFCLLQKGQEYKPHEDYFHDTVNARPENGGQRIATVLMYLCAPSRASCQLDNRACSSTVHAWTLQQHVRQHRNAVDRKPLLS